MRKIATGHTANKYIFDKHHTIDHAGMKFHCVENLHNDYYNSAAA